MAEDLAWVVFFTDDTKSVEVLVEATGGRCLALLQAMTSKYHQVMGERAEEEEPLLPLKTVTGGAPQQKALGFGLDTDRVLIPLPDRNINELRAMLEDLPEERNKPTVTGALVLEGNLHHVAYEIRPGRYSGRRLLHLSKLHLNGRKNRRGGHGVGRRQKQRGCWV